jgi:hypothetical protein
MISGSKEYMLPLDLPALTSFLPAKADYNNYMYMYM